MTIKIKWETCNIPVHVTKHLCQKVYDILNKRFCDIYQSERFAKYHEVYKTIHWLANVPKVLHNDTQSSLKHTKRSVKCYPIYVQNMNKPCSQFHSPINISEIELTKKHLNYNQYGEGKMHMWNAIKIDETTEIQNTIHVYVSINVEYSNFSKGCLFSTIWMSPAQILKWYGS